MGFYEGPQEVLARSDNHHAVVIRCSDRAFTGFSCRAIYLYPVLIYRGKYPASSVKKVIVLLACHLLVSVAINFSAIVCAITALAIFELCPSHGIKSSLPCVL